MPTEPSTVSLDAYISQVKELRASGKSKEAMHVLDQALESYPESLSLSRYVVETCESVYKGREQLQINTNKKPESTTTKPTDGSTRDLAKASSGTPYRSREAEDTGFKKPPKELGLYELLQVPVDADESTIKKAYYKMAREVHPDKNPDDAESTEKFQKLGQAYQILSNPETRKLYDKYGMKGLKDSNYEPVNAAALFAVLFGTDEFEKYIGELQMTAIMRMSEEKAAEAEAKEQALNEESLGGGLSLDAEELEQAAKLRQAALVKELVTVLEPWVQGEKKAFEDSMRKEAKKLSETTMGGPMLLAIGSTYMQRGNIALGKDYLFGIPGMVENVKFKTQKMGSVFKLISSAVNVMNESKEIEKKMMEEQSGEVDGKQQIDFAMKALQVIWHMTAVDIESTLDSVCLQVLSPESLPAEVKNQKLTPSKSNLANNQSNDFESYLKQGIEKLFTEKTELAEGVAATSREDILHARASGLRKLGSIFLEFASPLDPNKLHTRFNPDISPK